MWYVKAYFYIKVPVRIVCIKSLSPLWHQQNRCVQREVNRQKIGHKLCLRDEHEAVIIFRYPYSKRWCIYRVVRRGGATRTLNLSYSLLDNWLTNLCELCLGMMDWHHMLLDRTEVLRGSEVSFNHAVSFIPHCNCWKIKLLHL